MKRFIHSVFAFRRQAGDLTDAKPVYGRTGLEIAQTAVPLLTVLVLAGIGTSTVLNINRPAEAQDL